MKTINLLFFFTFFFVQANLIAQKNFEGIIKFKVELKDKTGEVSDQQMKEFIGDEQIYYLKKDKYKSVMNGLLRGTLFYNGNDTVYTKMNGTEALMYNLVTTSEDEKVISYEFKHTEEKVAGFECKLMLVKTNKTNYQYYYSDKVSINPEYYKNHHMNLWSFFMTKTNGGISLKVISESEEFKSTMIAQSVKREEIDTVIFEKPKHLPIVKMPKD
ncbi:hypothetical protein RQM59_00235 [Flavobacteriaceae bacterium S356]|uniref:DUF4412 domain-containing protein n=1 Tax=Asprobacillus argus TaxID=3076534 RepID=A0ABU3LC41_9FLAO|nr:hypothetical protein [Flavobacteriaceae bacterium S356]